MQYDQFGSVGDHSRGGVKSWGNINDIFGFGNKRSRIGPDTRSSLRISLADSIFGCERAQSIKRVLACETCKSTGDVSGTEKICSACNGQGQKIISPNPYTQYISFCGVCQGAGKVAQSCEKCEGVGFFQKNEKVNIKLPQNLKDTATIRIQDKGNAVYQSDDTLYIGSHYIVIDFPKTDKGVMRRGNDLYTNVQVPIDKILSEDEIQIKIFDREEVPLKLKSNHDFYKPYVVKPDFLNGGSFFIKVLPQIPPKYVDADKRQSLVKALREAYGESESVIHPSNDGS
jgi:molecular chaperone DnaJ